MQDNFIKILFFLLLLSSCKQESKTEIAINPLKIEINGTIKLLQENLKKRSVTLVYENSYEGENRGIKYFYFDDEADSLYYHFDIYTINDKIKGIEAGIFSKQLKRERLFSKVEEKILPNFKSSTINFTNTKTEKIIEKDSTGLYSFEIKTKELQEKK
jgi:hypothetical protein